MALVDAAHLSSSMREGTARALGPLVYSTMFDYDFAVTGDPSTAKNISTQFVPTGAKVIGGWYKILTTFTSSTSASTPSLQLVGANDLVSAIAINGSGSPWTIDLTKDRPLLAISTTLAASVKVQILRAVEALTAGKLIGVVYWVLPENLSSGH